MAMDSISIDRDYQRVSIDKCFRLERISFPNKSNFCWEAQRARAHFSCLLSTSVSMRNLQLYLVCESVASWQFQHSTFSAIQQSPDGYAQKQLTRLIHHLYLHRPSWVRSWPFFAAIHRGDSPWKSFCCRARSNHLAPSQRYLKEIMSNNIQ